MAQKIDGKLQCEECRTIYLSIPRIDNDDGPVFCSECGAYMGRWRDVRSEFSAQGGQNGVFELSNGQIIRIEFYGKIPRRGP
ncbi:hypothetical protein SAMN05428967_1572 [Phyllobacterium sp. YR620]|jgi:hypothetical protein|nr:hypothetical protein SAMN05428967_1572 [Phyllobacterium sp. YR620]SFI69530.1 hypothetical protein SAMN04515648_1211 [Phyllobacterium sp. CL33Tsu]